ncbi:MAG: hypothetical protein IAE79_01600, partial [Anaerolinea sp.]|nr:hypothetical protein [Anaerolinea sp.]
VSTGANTGARRETWGRGDAITVAVRPLTDEAQAGVYKDICDIWKRLPRPSLTQACVAYFGSKNSVYLAVTRSALEWGRENGLIHG